jgi:high-affinity nickel-transport protein
MRDGTTTKPNSSASCNNRGLMYRFFGKWMRSIDKEWKLYPVGVSSVWALTPRPRSCCSARPRCSPCSHVPWYSIMCLPILFTAGMVLMDTIDCMFMNVAYGWALFNPVRKIFYNLAITGLSVFDLLSSSARSRCSGPAHELHWHGAFWRFMSNFDINTAGFIIVGCSS